MANEPEGARPLDWTEPLPVTRSTGGSVANEPRFKLPGEVLTVIIRDDSPAMYTDDGPTYRSVHIKLTEEQRNSIALRRTGSSGLIAIHECISKCFIEPEG